MLLSRVADALYWISRYLERAEHSARLIEVRLDLGLDRTAGRRVSFDDAAFFDAANGESVAAFVYAARENARQVREEISSEMWQQVNGLYLRLREAGADEASSARPHYLCRMVIEGVHLFQGVTDATMGHGEGWQYLQVGRFIERAGATGALLDQHFREGSAGRDPEGWIDHVEWTGLLRSCAALEAYCRCYTADLTPERVAEFLLLNAELPRSVRFAAARIEAALRDISVLTGRGASGRALRLAGRLHASLDFGQVDEILSEDPHEYLSGISRQCAQIHAAVYQSYISYPIESAIAS